MAYTLRDLVEWPTSIHDPLDPPRHEPSSPYCHVHLLCPALQAPDGCTGPEYLVPLGGLLLSIVFVPN